MTSTPRPGKWASSWAKGTVSSRVSPPGPATGPASAPAKAKVVNTHCPITGAKIDPANVADSLIREYKGQKIGFCCGGCPEAFEKLSDADKAAKLKAAM